MISKNNVSEKKAKPLWLSRLVSQFSGGRLKYGWWKADYVSEEAPIILGGCSRSGTTLLREMLSSHPDVMIGPETAIFIGNKNLSHLTRVTGLSHQSLLSHLRRSCCLAEFAQLVLQDLLRSEGKRIWGEKTPFNVRCVQDILRFFPNAKFIHIIRDGRDVACSLRTHPKYEWMNGKMVENNAVKDWRLCVDEWVADVQQGLRFRGHPNYYEIRYEDIVSSPKDESEKLLSWLRLKWDPRVIDEFQSDHHVNHPELSGPIQSKSVKRWRRDLPLDARRYLVEQAGDLLMELNYVKNHNWQDEIDG